MCGSAVRSPCKRQRSSRRRRGPRSSGLPVETTLPLERSSVPRPRRRAMDRSRPLLVRRVRDRQRVPLATSERRVEDVVNVAAKGCGADRRQFEPTTPQLIEGSGRPWEGNELGNRSAGTSDFHPHVACARSTISPPGFLRSRLEPFAMQRACPPLQRLPLQFIESRTPFRDENGGTSHRRWVISLALRPYVGDDEEGVGGDCLKV